MEKQTIDGAIANPGAPKNWDPSVGTCGGLPIRVFWKRDSDDIAYVESAWKPTPEELALLNAGGNVILRVIGWQVPVSVYVEEAGQACRDAAILDAMQHPDLKEGAHGQVGDRDYVWKKGMWLPAVWIGGAVSEWCVVDVKDRT